MTITARWSGTNIRQKLLDVCSCVGSTYTNRLKNAILYCDSVGLALKTIGAPEACLYSTPTSFANDWFVYNLFRKSTYLPGYDSRSRKMSAARALIQSELECHTSNVRFSSLSSSSANLLDFNEQCSLVGGAVAGVELLCDVRSEIARILGPFNISKMQEECRWSSGATAHTRRGVPLSLKHSKAWDVSSLALPFAKHVIAADPLWVESALGFKPEGEFSLLDNCFNITNANRAICVDKNAQTDRVIAAEPALNAFLQQGVHSFLVRRLRKWGCHLDTQVGNQMLAQKAYAEGLSTLDLERASDTISLRLVESLLPPEYFSYLFALRCPLTAIGDRVLRLNKFSSMGNAFTFELETLIFYSLVRVISRKNGIPFSDIGVFGDDIICNRSIAGEVISALNFFGFTVNNDKSFVDGYFFESCGKHFFQGVDVTPVYLDGGGYSLDREIIEHNALVRWSVRVHLCCFSKLLRSFLKGYSFAEKKTRKQPYSDDLDVAYITVNSSWDLCRNHGYLIKSLIKEVRYRKVPDFPLLAYKLRDFRYTNEHPKGYSQVVRSELVVTVVRRWPYASFRPLQV